MNYSLLIITKLKFCLISTLYYTKQDNKQLFSKENPHLMLELFFKMAESVFWRNDGVTTNMTFQVMTRPEISDMAGFDILGTTGRVTRRRTRAIAKRFGFHANAIKEHIRANLPAFHRIFFIRTLNHLITSVSLLGSKWWWAAFLPLFQNAINLAIHFLKHSQHSNILD